MAAFNFYRSASSPTDENWSKDPPSNLYVIDSFPGWLAKQTAGERSAGAGELLRDSIRVGDLLRRNGRK